MRSRLRASRIRPLSDGRQKAGRAAGGRPLAAGSRAGQPAWQAALLAMQRAAGNGAVAGALSLGRAPASVQRVTPDEFAVRGTFPDSAEHPDLIFFDMGSAALRPPERAKIPDLAAAPAAALTLRGSASEEGPTGVNTAVVGRRIDAVEGALRGAGWAGAVTREPDAGAGLGNIDYRRARWVEVRHTGTTSGQPDCSADPDGHPNACGAAPNAFTDAHKRAREMVNEAIAALDSTPPDPDAMALMDPLFGGAGGAPAVLAGLKAIKGQLAEMVPFTATHGHRCVNDCDSTCGGGATAYNTGTGSSAMMTLCNAFVAEPDLDERAAVLVHEGSHGTPGLETEDKSYQWQRLFRPSRLTGRARLPAASALKNADSFATFVRLVDSPGSVGLGPTGPEADVHHGHMTVAQKEAADVAVAWVQQWLVQSSGELSSLHGTMVETMATPTAGPDPWTDPYYEETMRRVASRFGLTHPPGAPTMQDRAAVAGIFDRLSDLERTVDQRLVLEKVAAPGTTWSPGAGDTVRFGTHFWGLSAKAQAELLLARLVAVTRSIPASRRAAYISLVKTVVEHGNFGTP